MRLARVALPDDRVIVARVESDAVWPVADDGPLAVVHAARSEAGRAPAGRPVPRDQVRLCCPVPDAPSVRDCAGFEAHLRNARIGTGQDIPEVWYDAPAFYFSNPAALIGPDDPVIIPRGCRALDYELSVACVIGAEVADLDAADPTWSEAVAGFLLFNDWSARDLQMHQRSLQMGPGKGKDFATSIGPWLATVDEFADLSGGRPACAVEASVNGQTWSRGELGDVHFTWGEILAHASANTRLRPGDVIASGTVGTGCIIELRALHGKERYPWLGPGDVVELHGGPLGTLRNPVVARS